MDIFRMNYVHEFEPHECVIFVQSPKIGTHENKTIHTILRKQEITYSIFETV